MRATSERRRQRRGAAMVEFILILPLLMLLLMAVLEFGLLALDVLTVRQACRLGAHDAGLGKPVEAIRRTVLERAPEGVREDAITIEYLLRQTGPDGQELDGWQEDWRSVRNVPGGTANNVPTGAIIRVRVKEFPHRMVTGSFFSWLPGYRENWDIGRGAAAPAGTPGVPVLLVPAEGSQPRM